MLKSKEDYELIPIDKIDDEARELAVLWSVIMIDDSLKQKHKLASDIMNYAKLYHKKQSKNLIQLSDIPEGYSIGNYTEIFHNINNPLRNHKFLDIKIKLVKK